MKNNLKKLLCAVLSAAMAAGTVVLPITASADEYTPIFEGDTVLNEWKFDFGAEGSAPETGYTLVTPDTNFTANNEGEYQYGFLGTDPEDYNLTDRYDGWTTQKGQTIELAAGGGTGLNDAVGVVGAGGTGENAGKDAFGNKADKYYPTRFALKVEDDTYYRVKATVTTLDPAKDATVSLYTERKHPLYTEKTIAAGTTYKTEFSVRVTPIYYQKSSPTGPIKDEMVTVGVLGENSALASVEIQQVTTIPTLWVLGDSTVTDGNTTLPFFPLQNYTGVGTGLTKYLRRDWAMVNEGEGGLNADDTLHFNMVKDRIKAGDYMYVEYGHNHKKADNSLDPDAFFASLSKDQYYKACHEASAKLIIVSPVQSIAGWGNVVNDRWDDRFGGTGNMADKGRQYVEGKITGGATDIAFVNLTKTSVEFVNKVTEDGNNSQDAAKFYYQTNKGGGTDASHPNDAGAENFADCFFKAAKEVTDTTQQAVLADLLDNMTDETPNLVSDEIVSGGIGGSEWPQYIVPTTEKYPVLINDVAFNEDGTIKQVDVTTRAAEISMSGTYGAVIVTIYKADGSEKGKFYAINQVDNSTGYGPQTVDAFRADPSGLKLEEGDTYSAVVVEADANVQPVQGGKTYSAVYKPTDIAKHLLINERNEEKYENFNYYGATYAGEDTLEKYNGWTKRGSSGMTLTLGQSGDTKYATISTDGIKDGNANQGSTYITKDLAENIGSSGRYVVSMDMKYASGGGMNVKLATGNTDKAPWGSDSITLFSVGADGKVTLEGKDAGQISAINFSNVKYIIDMDLGTASLSIDGGDEVTANLADYQSTDVDAKHPKFTCFMFEGNKVAYDVKVANLTVAKLKNKTLPEYTLSLGTYDNAKGSVKVSTGVPTGFTLSYADGNAVVTAEKSDAAATLIEVKRNADGTLNGITPTSLTFTDALTKPTSVTAGSTLMLWDTLSGMKPLAPAITAETTPAADSVTASINTVITVDAAAKDGYVFMGWLDKDGEKVSDDAVYSFRLRADTELTPNFVKEPRVTDVANYTLSADKTSVKAVAGAAVNVNITDAKDNEGTPISIVKNEDAQWSCDEVGVTVTNGVVTFGDTFSMGGAETKTVVVKATLNNIEKSFSIVAHIYDYYEDFSGTLENANWFVNKGADANTAGIVNGALSLHVSGSSNNNYSGAHFAAQADVVNKLVTIKFDYKVSSVSTGNNASSIHLADMALTDNAPTWNTTYGDSSSGIDFKIGSEGLVLAADTEYEVTITINNKTKTAEISAQPASGEAVTHSLATTRKAINTIFFRPGRNVTDTVDNVRVTMTDAE